VLHTVSDNNNGVALAYELMSFSKLGSTISHQRLYVRKSACSRPY
jgi:hypothetical protein